jgi:hypothetical protein
MKCNETLSKWCKNKHGASKIMDMLETYQLAFNLSLSVPSWPLYIGGQVSGIGRDSTQITVSTYDMNSYFD